MSPLSAIQLRGSGPTRGARPAAAPTAARGRRRPPSQGVCPFFGLTGPARPSFCSRGGKGGKGRVEESPSSHSQVGCSLSALWRQDGCRPSGHGWPRGSRGVCSSSRHPCQGAGHRCCFPLTLLSHHGADSGVPVVLPRAWGSAVQCDSGRLFAGASPLGPAPDGLQRALCQGRRGVCRAPKRGAWDPHPGTCLKGPSDVTLRRVHCARPVFPALSQK